MPWGVRAANAARVGSLFFVWTQGVRAVSKTMTMTKICPKCPKSEALWFDRVGIKSVGLGHSTVVVEQALAPAVAPAYVLESGDDERLTLLLRA